MPQFEPVVLVAYVDGELDAETRRAVERAMVEDPKIADTVRELRESAAWLRSDLGDAIHEPIPARLLDTVYSGEASSGFAAGRQGLFRTTMPFLGEVTKIAAAIAVLLVGVAGGYWGGGYRMDRMSAETTPTQTEYRTFEASMIDAALERQPSGDTVDWTNPYDGQHSAITLVKTYHSPATGFCREYRRTRGVGENPTVVHGVACRQGDGSWFIKYELVAGRRIGDEELN